jgi:hypothetical protein
MTVTRAAVLSENRLPCLLIMQIGESLDSLSDLERLLRCTNGEAHSRISGVLWDAESDNSALSGLQQLSNESLKQWEAPNDIRDDSRVEAIASG